MITLNPAASTIAIDSLVERLTPPRFLPDGDGRINTCSSRLRYSILVLSPNIDPPLMEELGSTAKTANLFPSCTINCPIDSIKVDLPTPGGPEIPILILDPSAVRMLSSNFSERVTSLAFFDSTRVIAWAIAFLSPDTTPSTKSVISDSSNLILKFKNSLIHR